MLALSKAILKDFILEPEQDLERVKQELVRHIDLTRMEPGCLVFNAIQNTADPKRFEVYEEFVNRAAFSFHQHGVRGPAWGKITGNVVRCYEIEGVDAI
ncbi:MAG: antibiotic biosynthesis monooxygenase [Gammaproteobacteria bacterium]|nr:antibiotic biosynthesis monooxygenase [Gammaproteobacteria bacterium]